jgi:hypothetical protein
MFKMVNIQIGLGTKIIVKIGLIVCVKNITNSKHRRIRKTRVHNYERR